MLTWANVMKAPAFKTLEAITQAAYVLAQYVPQAAAKIKAGEVISSEYANQNLKAITHFRDQLLGNVITPDVLALYAAAGGEDDLVASRDQAVAEADKRIADLTGFLTDKGLAVRVLSAQESAELLAKLEAAKTAG